MSGILSADVVFRRGRGPKTGLPEEGMQEGARETAGCGEDRREVSFEHSTEETRMNSLHVLVLDSGMNKQVGSRGTGPARRKLCGIAHC